MKKKLKSLEPSTLAESKSGLGGVSLLLLLLLTMSLTLTGLSKERYNI